MEDTVQSPSLVMMDQKKLEMLRKEKFLKEKEYEEFKEKLKKLENDLDHLDQEIEYLEDLHPRMVF